MTDEALQLAYGRATLDPASDVLAGSYTTQRLTYIVGEKGVASGGRIRVSTDSDTDWAFPQFHDPTAPDYMTVEAPSDARVSIMVVGVQSVLLVIRGRALSPGERLVLTYGDRTGGSPGTRAQTFLEDQRYFRVAVDADGGGTFVTLAEPPSLSIVGGPAVKLEAVAPSTVVAGNPFPLLVRAEDAWGNPAAPYRGSVELQAPSGSACPVQRYTFDAEDGGVHRFEGCRVSEPGVYKITVVDSADGLQAESNPIRCTKQAGQYSLYWGDPHGGQIALAAKIPDFFRYARDVAAIDFAGYQRNDHVLSIDDWAVQQQAERDFDQPGRFVPLPGFEWSAVPSEGGHHNVYFRRHSQPIRRHSHRGLADKSDVETDLPHILDVYRAYRGQDVVITPHVGGSHADLTHHEPTLEPALEITSDHGTFEWFLEESLRHGYRMGFVGGSDSHNGRPGADTPGWQERRYAKGGLTGLYAPALTLEAVHQALRARRCYATTGARMLVQLDADGHMMGEDHTTSARPTISLSVAGTAPLESVELFRGLERIYSHPLDTSASSNRVRVLWEGASRKTSYSGVIWDGRLKVVGTTIAAVEKLRFDSPRSRVFDRTAANLRWHSVACGYRSGIILDLADADETELQLVVNTSLISRPYYGGHGDEDPSRMSYSPAENVTFSCSLKELASGQMEVPLGRLNRKIVVSLAPEPGGAEMAEFTFTDPAPQPGINPYWVRIVQTDMEMAWTSPVFVDYVAAPR
ncbi:MAG: hypothetical protein CL878_01080 [Dehalococcoidia bacterium]|nr:hypothetical protein [Dehalococcoidia bacterium]